LRGHIRAFGDPFDGLAQFGQARLHTGQDGLQHGDGRLGILGGFACRVAQFDQFGILLGLVRVDFQIFVQLIDLGTDGVKRLVDFVGGLLAVLGVGRHRGGGPGNAERQ